MPSRCSNIFCLVKPLHPCVLVPDRAQIFVSQNTLHVSYAEAGKDVAAVTQAALRAKEAADAEFQKISNAAAIAAARFCASTAADAPAGAPGASSK